MRATDQILRSDKSEEGKKQPMDFQLFDNQTNVAHLCFHSNIALSEMRSNQLIEMRCLQIGFAIASNKHQTSLFLDHSTF